MEESRPDSSDSSDSSSITSAESVIRRRISESDASTRSIIEVPTEDSWEQDFQFQCSQGSSIDQSQQNTSSDATQREITQIQDSPNTSSNTSTSSTSDAPAQQPSHPNPFLETSTESSQSSSASEVPQAEMIPKRKGRIRACKFFKKEITTDGKVSRKEINYKE